MDCRIFPLIGAFIVSHKAVELLMITATIKTAPVSASDSKFQTAYYWFYDATHQFFNITNTRLSVQPTITPPETAAIPK